MKALAAAICAVMSEVHRIPETGHNERQNYRYASDSDLLKALQPAMAKNGLCLIPTESVSTTVVHSGTVAGAAQWRTEVLVTYLLLHTSGDFVPVKVPGCGVDGGDKGVFKALTGALKYALRQTFLVPTGDDAEKTPPKEEEPTKKERPAPAPAREQKPKEKKAWKEGDPLDGPHKDAAIRKIRLLEESIEKNLVAEIASKWGGAAPLVEWADADLLGYGKALAAEVKRHEPREREPGEEG